MEFLLILLAAIVVIGYIWYVQLIGKRNKALEALSGIDVHLKLRSNLIPNVLKIAKKFMEHEKSILEEITALRTQANKDYNVKDTNELKQHFDSVEQLSHKMGQLMVQVEAYPELKSDSTMLQAQQSYNEVEAKIAAARRFYNASVTALNNSVQIFPGNIIASIASVGEMPFYEAPESASEPVDADKYL